MRASCAAAFFCWRASHLLSSCSRQASSAAFSKDFVAAGGLTALLASLQLKAQPRATKANVRKEGGWALGCPSQFVTPQVLRALTLILEEKWAHAELNAIAARGGITGWWGRSRQLRHPR